MQNTDPDVRRYDSPDEWIACPECRGWTVALDKYELHPASESPDVDFEWYELLLWGWTVYVYYCIYNYIYELFIYKHRQKKLARLKQEILPTYPRSLICPKCFHVIKRGQQQRPPNVMGQAGA
jgi:hypothetical protein